MPDNVGPGGTIPSPLPEGFYWVHTNEYVVPAIGKHTEQTFTEWLAFNKARVLRIKHQDTGEDAGGNKIFWNLFEVSGPGIAYDYIGLPGPLAIAPNGAATTEEDVIQAPDPQDIPFFPETGPIEFKFPDLPPWLPFATVGLLALFVWGIARK